VDGEVTSYFEWLGAGRYRPDLRSGAMHGGESPVHEMLYGSDGETLYIRLDANVDARYGIEFETGTAETHVARGRILEMSAPKAGRRFRVSIARDGLPPVTIPAQNWIEL